MKPYRFNISKPLREIIKTFGFNYNDVRSITITPTTTILTVYRKTEDGSKFVDEHGNAATTIYELPIDTKPTSKPRKKRVRK